MLPPSSLPNNGKLEQFITRLKFDVKASSPKLFFKPMRWLTAEEYAVVQEQGATPEAVQACVMTVAQMDKVVAVVPAAAPKLAAPVAGVNPLGNPLTNGGMHDEEDPPAPAPSVGKKRGRPAGSTNKGNGGAPATEPTIRTAPKAPEMPARPTAASVAAGWDTDD